MRSVNKKSICILLIMVLVVSACSCGSSGSKEQLAWNSKAVTAAENDSSELTRFTRLNVDDDGRLIIDRKMRDNEVPMGQAGTWSVFVYICGTDLESDDGSATLDLREMMKVGSDEKLNIIVQTGGARSWDLRGISSRKLQRYRINEGGKELLCEGTRKSMGAADTLYEFLSWGVENYPAEHMAFVLWNHGSGSINGVCFDELYDDDSLYVTEIEEALTRVYDEMTCRFEFVGFDACLMATVEMANMLVPYAKYLIGSEEVESGYGWDYKAFLGFIKKYPDSSISKIGEVICKSYYAHCEYTGEEDEATLSVIDLSKTDDFLVAFNDAAHSLSELSSDISGISVISRAVSKAENYGGNNQIDGYTNMVDIGDILLQLEDSVPCCRDAYLLLKDMVVYKVNGKSCPKSNGLAVYYPLCVQGSSELNILRNICISPYYMNFIETVAYGAQNGDIDDYNGSDWSDSDYYYEDGFGFNDNFADEYDYGIWDGWFESDDDGWYTTDNNYIDFKVKPYVNNDCDYTMIIAEKSLDYVQSIRFALFKENDEEELIYLGNDNAVAFDLDTGEVFDLFTGEWPMLPDGQMLAIYLSEEGSDYNIYSIPVMLNDKEMNLKVRMDLDYSNVFGSFSVLGVWEGISESGQAGRSTLTINKGDVIRPVYETFDDKKIYGDEYIAGDDFNIEVGMLEDAYYSYTYEIIDVFGNSTFTDEAVYHIEGGVIYGVPDENADEYDSYYSDYNVDEPENPGQSIWNGSYDGWGEFY
ncbi:MAG: hypothetical protein IJM37_07335 [Lachnospiraceae bacterium]|nr:hypothetical protein [Lachnospiraceae bacterium]